MLLVTERFAGLADATRRAKGLPDAPMIVLERSELVEYAGEDGMERAALATLREFTERFVAPEAIQ